MEQELTITVDDEASLMLKFRTREDADAAAEAILRSSDMLETQIMVACAGGCGVMLDPDVLAENATECCPDCQGTDRDPDPWAQRDPDELHDRNR